MARPNPNKLFSFFRSQRTRRTSADWQRRRRVTAQQISPRKARDHKAARLIRMRRQTNRAMACSLAHIRAIAAGKGDGFRCPDCRYIPFFPWESNGQTIDDLLKVAIESVRR